jgi:hypothetical protein
LYVYRWGTEDVDYIVFAHNLGTPTFGQEISEKKKLNTIFLALVFGCNFVGK